MVYLREERDKTPLQINTKEERNVPWKKVLKKIEENVRILVSENVRFSFDGNSCLEKKTKQEETEIENHMRMKE